MIQSTKLLARLLTTSGPGYMKKFIDKTGGVAIMRHRLQRHWNLPAVWLSCFAVLFGKDAACLDFNKFDLFALLEAFGSTKHIDIVYPEVLPVIMSLLREGLLSLVRQEPDAASPKPENDLTSASSPTTSTQNSHFRQRSLTMNSTPQKTRKIALFQAAIILLKLYSCLTTR